MSPINPGGLDLFDGALGKLEALHSELLSELTVMSRLRIGCSQVARQMRADDRELDIISTIGRCWLP